MCYSSKERSRRDLSFELLNLGNGHSFQKLWIELKGHKLVKTRNMPFGIIFWSGLLTHVRYVRVIWYDCEPLTSILRTYEISCLNTSTTSFGGGRVPRKKRIKIVKRIMPKNSHMYYYISIEFLYLMRVPDCTTIQENKVNWKNKKEPRDALKEKQMHDNHLLRHKLIYGWSWRGKGVKMPELLFLRRLCQIVVQTGFLLVLKSCKDTDASKVDVKL